MSYIPPKQVRSYMPRIDWHYKSDNGHRWFGNILDTSPPERFIIRWQDKEFRPDFIPDETPYVLDITRITDDYAGLFGPIHRIGMYASSSEAQAAAQEWIDDIDAARGWM